MLVFKRKVSKDWNLKQSDLIYYQKNYYDFINLKGNFKDRYEKRQSKKNYQKIWAVIRRT